MYVTHANETFFWGGRRGGVKILLCGAKKKRVSLYLEGERMLLIARYHTFRQQGATILKGRSLKRVFQLSLVAASSSFPVCESACFRSDGIVLLTEIFL